MQLGFVFIHLSLPLELYNDSDNSLILSVVTANEIMAIDGLAFDHKNSQTFVSIVSAFPFYEHL